MRYIVIQEFITLNGVIQAPGGPEEDKSNEFKYGGWTAPYFYGADKEANEFMQKNMNSTDLLLGKKTYKTSVCKLAPDTWHLNNYNFNFNGNFNSYT